MPAESGGRNLLIVEDDAAVRRLLEKSLAAPGRSVSSAADGAEAREELARGKPGVVILDLGLPDADGVELLSEILAGNPHAMVIVLTGRADQPSVVEAMRRGALEYIVKPFDPDSLSEVVDRAFRKSGLSATAAAGMPAAAGPVPEGLFIGKTPAILEVFKMIGMLAASEVPVLVTGESGTGKELVARSLHRYGPNPGGPFVVVDCASLPATLLEAELFGHEKGAFTGADAARPGRFEQADGGTIFLDEAGNIPMEFQPKLLRAIQERTVQRLGSTKTVGWNARVISASNTKLWDLAKAGKYREDLLFRLAGAEISLPSLHERRPDIPLLVAHFLERAGRQGERLSVSPEAAEKLASYNWPGNVRELRHALERAAALSRGSVIDAEHLPEKVRAGTTPDAGSASAQGEPLRRSPSWAHPRERIVEGLPASCDEVMTMDALRVRYARHVLELCGGNKSETARRLGIDRSTLYELLAEE